MGIRNIRGAFFSIDALIALLIIFLVIIIAVPTIKQRNVESKLDQDILVSLSAIKVSEFDNVYVQSLISQGIITNTNNSLLEQIGEFYVTNVSLATNIADEFLATIETKENVGIWLENTLIAAKNTTAFQDARQIDASRQILSGVMAGQNITGYSARAFLSSNVRQAYTYFGGYIGEGNITATLSYNGTIQSASLEIATNADFQIYINGLYAGNYTKSLTDTTPITYDLTAHITKFSSGTNLVEFRGQNLYIAGGFIKITYTAEPAPAAQKYYFPGIQGIINIYDGLFIPTQLNSMSVSLHLDSNLTTFLTIGNTTVFNGSTNGEQVVTLANSQLAAQLNYNKLVNKTIPIRLGLSNVSVNSTSQAVDLLSVTDLSGSMEDNCPSGYQTNISISPCKINDAKVANNLLIDAILNVSVNRIGLAGFQYYAKKKNFHQLSVNTTSLKNVVSNVWDAAEWTCTCCGIMKAISCINPTLFASNFNGQSAGTDPIGWRLFEPSATSIDITEASLEGDRAAKITRFGTSNPFMYRVLPLQEDPTSVEFFVNHSTGTGRVRLEIEGGDSTATIYSDYVVLKMYGGQIRNNDVAITPYSLNQSYRLRVELTPGTTTYRLYVNNVSVGGNLPAIANKTNVGRILFTTESAVVSYTLDDVKTFLTQPICTNTNVQNRSKAIVLMGDGGANKHCGLDPVPDWNNNGNTVDDAVDQAIEAACIAKTQHNITVHAIAFDVAPGSTAELMLQQIAACGQGSFYTSNITQLVQTYQEVSQNILATYNAQTLNVTGIPQTRLYPDSYITLNYAQLSPPFGISITTEQQFTNTTTVSFSLSQNATPVTATAISYSGPLWTNIVKLNNNTIYNINQYSNIYTNIGDPYAIHLPKEALQQNNTLVLTTASSPSSNASGSVYNKVIYTVIKNVSAYSPISAIESGCNWTVEFEDNTNSSVTIPQNYTGTSLCQYTPASISYNINDALQAAAYNLFQQLDLDNDGRLDFIFSANEVTIETTQVQGIPFPWSTEVQVRRWV